MILRQKNIDDPTPKAVVKWRNHPSILARVSEYKNQANVFFIFFSNEHVLAEIKVLDVSKRERQKLKIIKANENFFSEVICFYLNKSLENGVFPNFLKYHTSFLKKNTCTSKNGYRPVSNLLVFSKIIERLLSRQLLMFFHSVHL